MEDSNPAKRRRLSPSAEVPIDAPRSPSKIPIPARNRSQSQDATRSGSKPRRPSFASPTKASLSRHNPQIMHKIGPSGRYEVVNTDANAGPSTVKDSTESATEGGGEIAGGTVQVPQTPDQGDVEASQAKTSGEGNGSTQISTQSHGARSVTGSLASAPRRRSRTPGKPVVIRGSGNTQSQPREEEELLAGPIRRPGLRRSPPASSQAQSESQSQSQPQTQRFSPTEIPDTGRAANIGIVRKPALRRSPPTASQSTSQSQSQKSAEKLDIGPGPIRKSALRRSPPVNSSQNLNQAPSQPINVQEQTAEPQPAIQSAPQLPTQTKPEAETQVQSELPVPSQPEPEVERPTQHTPTHLRHRQGTERPPRIPTAGIRGGGNQISRLDSQLEELREKQELREEQELLEEIRASPLEQSQPDKEDERPDYDLPPTPVQLGIDDPIVTTPPRGIHDKPKKKKSKKLKSSPLKSQSQANSSAESMAPKDTIAQGTGSQGKPFNASSLKPPSQDRSRAQSFAKSMAPKPLPTYHVARSTPAENYALSRDEDIGQDEDVEMTGVSRHGLIPPIDQYAQKRKLRDQLLEELQELQADIALAETENERLHNLHETGGDTGTLAPNQFEIEELLKRSGYGDDKQNHEEEPLAKPLSSFHFLSYFLPFSAHPKHQPTPIKTVDEDPLPSHLPIEQENPLPYLQLFTPLQFSSVITILPPSLDPDTSMVSTSTSSSTEVLKDIIQYHTITARSPASVSLFKSAVSILVNTTTFSIESIKINSISPAAKAELGSFLAKIAQAGTGDVLAGNVATLFWSMGRWYEVARKRAIFWVRIDEEFGPKSDFATRSRKVTGEKAKAKRGKKRKGAPDDDDDPEANRDEDAAAIVEREDEKFRKLTRKEYLSNMGRQSTTLSIPTSSARNKDMSMRIEWRICFDWTGETENLIEIGVVGGKAGGWPGSWRKHDTRKSLDKLPATFERMVSERGPLSAVRGVVELLVGDDV